MTIPERYFVAPIQYRVAMHIVVTRHYARRKAPCSIALGLFDHENGDRLAGVITYGKSASTTLRNGVCGPEESNDVIELTRLWVEDGTPRNTESFFIRQSLQWVKGKIIVSFADSSKASSNGQVTHAGYVYQASNFLYCGLSQKFKDPVCPNNPNQHHTSWAKSCKTIVKGADYLICKGCGWQFKKKPAKGEPKFSLMKAVEELWGSVVYVNRPRKHRYVLFNVPQRRRRALMKKLRYPICDYPK